MSAAGEVAPVFVTWEEQVIRQERGNRVVHFYLKDAAGNSVLAVVGTERSVRHMMYVTADNFLQAYGSTLPINGCKWRARREVADWLTCLVSQNGPHPAGVQLDDTAQAIESLNMLTAGIHISRKTLPDKLISRKLKFQSSDIEWSGDAWSCAKQLKHYSGFCRNGTTIYVHSFIYIMAEEENPYIGYLEDMYEDKKKQKKVKVRWFHHGQEVKHVFPQLILQEGEVFITSHVQVVSAECVNGPAIVLTPKHYEQYQAAVPHTSLSEIHICFRQFKSNKLKPFTLTKLRGYSNQSILSCLDIPIIPKRKAKCQKPPTEDDENITQDDLLRSTNKRSRISTGHQVLEKGSSGLQNSAPMNEMTKSEPKYPSLKLKLSRKTMGIKVIGPKPQDSLKVGEKIEYLSHDSGIRGCWFRCEILSQKKLKVQLQYDDVMDAEDESKKLEEWVPASRVAAPDKLSMRCSGRLTVRPRPPEYTAGHTFEVGAAVDAWYNDGWWEGVITAVNASGDGILQVYCPGEEEVLKVNKKNLRISRDWIDNKWVDIVGKPDICSYLPPNVSSSIRLSANSAVVDGSMSVESKSSSIAKIEVAQKVEAESSGLEAPEDLESLKITTLRKPLQAIDEDKDNSGGGSDDGTDDVDDERKSLCAIDEDKDNSGGSCGDGTDNADDDEGKSLCAIDEDKDNFGGSSDPLRVIDEDKDNFGGSSEPLCAIDEDMDNFGGSSDPLRAIDEDKDNFGGSSDPLRAIDEDKDNFGSSSDPLRAIDEDKDNSGGSSDDGTDNADGDRKPLDAFDEEDKDNSGGGSDDSTDNDEDADKTEEESEENLTMEENFDCSEAKLEAAKAIQVA